MKFMAGPELYDKLAKKYLEPYVRQEKNIKGRSNEQIGKIKKFYEGRYGG